MDPIDREVLALRHFEQLTNAETARVLGISETAASKRYVRALERLKEILDRPGRRPGRDLTMTELTFRGPTRVGELAEAFLERYRRGERPALTEYAERYPELAERSATLFPALVVMEEADSVPRRRGCHRTVRRRPRIGTAVAASGSATTGSSARSAGAAWASSTRPSRSRWAGTWP